MNTETKRAAILLAAVLSLALLVVVVVLKLINHDDAPKSSTFTLSQGETRRVEATSKTFVEESGTFGLPKSKVNLGYLNAFLTNPPALQQSLTNRSAALAQLIKIVAPTSTIGKQQLQEESDNLIYSVGVTGITAQSSGSGFIDDTGTRTVVVNVTFHSQSDFYALPQDAVADPDGFAKEWSDLINTYDEAGKITLKYESGKWLVYSVSGLRNPYVLAVNDGPIPYGPDKIDSITS